MSNGWEPTGKEWACPILGCERRALSKKAPKCPVHGKKMVVPSEPSVAERRAGIRRTRRERKDAV